MSAITPAASVLLSRGPGSHEVLVILRGENLRFFGGFWAFPGGKLTAEEAAAPDALDGLRRAACRELFEETGILVARTPDGRFPDIDSSLTQCRQALLDNSKTLASVLDEHGLAIWPGDFTFVGQITTPAFAPVRFATTFFAACAPPNQRVDIWPGELDRGEWVESRHMVDRWHAGADLLTPPSVMTLQALMNRSIDEAPGLLGPLYERLHTSVMHPIFVAPQVRMIPLRTVALPPSTHTNAYLVGAGPRYLIDPGPNEPDEQQVLFDVMDEANREDFGPTAIVLSHHHPDHVGAAMGCSERYHLPILAHRLTAERLQGKVRVDRFLEDGDRLDLGKTSGKSRPWHLDVLHTPGHASGHLAFFDPLYRLLFAGDMLSTVTSMVIAPPDGDLVQYLASLRRLRDLPTRVLLPAHGNISARPAQAIYDALDHRAKREEQLVTTMANGPASIDALTAILYRGTPERLLRFARAQVHAGLLKLQQEGRATLVDQDHWQLTL